MGKKSYLCPVNKRKVLIVGQGIAGSALASCYAKRSDVLLHVLDKGLVHGSSVVAAGLYNPIVFKRLTSSWQASILLDSMRNFFQEQEKLLGERFLFDAPIYKLFTEQREIDFWQKKQKEPELSVFLGDVEPVCNTLMLGAQIIAMAKVLQSGWIDVAKWLHAYRQFLLGQNILRQADFVAEDLVYNDETLFYKGEQYDEIILCQGATQSKFFQDLPFNNVKGEVLTVQSNTQSQKTWSKDIFFLPTAQTNTGFLYKTGSTFDWQDKNTLPTAQARLSLEEALQKIWQADYTVVAQEAGIRPVSIDRRPFLGRHPSIKGLSIFNALGAKGLMLAPYYAEHLYKHLEEQEELSKTVDIKRFERN